MRIPNPAQFSLPRPVLVAVATDSTIKAKTTVADPIHLPGLPPLEYGQDLEYGFGRKAPLGHDVGSDRGKLKMKMRALLGVFAAGDKARMAEALFDEFLDDSCRPVGYFEHHALTKAAEKHVNIQHFVEAAVSAPGMTKRTAGKIRIHQALQAAGWDLGKIAPPKDLKVPAFNEGFRPAQTGDYDNGLGLMINGVQHVYIFATHYYYDAGLRRYWIRLKYVLYDAFGLDDEDLEDHGAKSDSTLAHRAQIGITAWWQLQHQHGFTPLITRIILEKEFEAEAI